MGPSAGAERRGQWAKLRGQAQGPNQRKRTLSDVKGAVVQCGKDHLHEACGYLRTMKAGEAATSAASAASCASCAADVSRWVVTG